MSISQKFIATKKHVNSDILEYFLDSDEIYGSTNATVMLAIQFANDLSLMKHGVILPPEISSILSENEEVICMKGPAKMVYSGNLSDSNSTKMCSESDKKEIDSFNLALQEEGIEQMESLNLYSLREECINEGIISDESIKIQESNESFMSNHNSSKDQIRFAEKFVDSILKQEGLYWINEDKKEAVSVFEYGSFYFSLKNMIENFKGVDRNDVSQMQHPLSLLCRDGVIFSESDYFLDSSLTSCHDLISRNIGKWSFDCISFGELPDDDYKIINIFFPRKNMKISAKEIPLIEEFFRGKSFEKSFEEKIVGKYFDVTSKEFNTKWF